MTSHINPWRKDAINVKVGNDRPQLLAYIQGLPQLIADLKKEDLYNCTEKKIIFRGHSKFVLTVLRYS